MKVKTKDTDRKRVEKLIEELERTARYFYLRDDDAWHLIVKFRSKIAEKFGIVL